MSYYEWENTLMGPADDKTGFEQGAPSSSDFYKIYNNNHLKATQRSNLGVNLESSVLSGIGLADDTLLLSDNIFNIKNLMTLTNDYCHKYKVALVPSKTKLICMRNKNHESIFEYCSPLNPVKVNGEYINFDD